MKKIYTLPKEIDTTEKSFFLQKNSESWKMCFLTNTLIITAHPIEFLFVCLFVMLLLLVFFVQNEKKRRRQSNELKTIITIHQIHRIYQAKLKKRRKLVKKEEQYIGKLTTSNWVLNQENRIMEASSRKHTSYKQKCSIQLPSLPISMRAFDKQHFCRPAVKKVKIIPVTYSNSKEKQSKTVSKSINHHTNRNIYHPIINLHTTHIYFCCFSIIFIGNRQTKKQTFKT